MLTVNVYLNISYSRWCSWRFSAIFEIIPSKSVIDLYLPGFRLQSLSNVIFLCLMKDYSIRLQRAETSMFLMFTCGFCLSNCLRLVFPIHIIKRVKCSAICNSPCVFAIYYAHSLCFSVSVFPICSELFTLSLPFTLKGCSWIENWLLVHWFDWQINVWCYWS